MEERQFWVMSRVSWDWGLGLNRGEGPWGGELKLWRAQVLDVTSTDVEDHHWADGTPWQGKERQ